MRTVIGRGQASRAALSLLASAPGEYVLACFVPDAADGRCHTSPGMVQRISVR